REAAASRATVGRAAGLRPLVPARLPPLLSIPVPFLRQILVRSILVWLGVRGAAFLLFGLTVPALPAAGLVVALTVCLPTWDAWPHHGVAGKKRGRKIYAAQDRGWLDEGRLRGCDLQRRTVDEASPASSRLAGTVLPSRAFFALPHRYAG